MKGQQTLECVLPVPATDLWDVVKSLQLPRIFKDIPNYLEDFHIMGDGSVGTQFLLVMPEGSGPLGKYKEEIVLLDHDNRVKDVDVVEGGYMDLGYTFFSTRFVVEERSANSSLLRGILFCEIDDAKAAEHERLTNAMELDAVARAVAQHLRAPTYHPTKLFCEQSHELEAPFSADAVWRVYSTLIHPELMKEFVPDLKVLGDGSVGTLFHRRGTAEFPDYTERIVTLDHACRVKEVDVIEGGVLAKDFTFFRTRFEIVEKGPHCCIIRSIIRYELDPKSPTTAANLKLANVMNVVEAGNVTVRYLSKHKAC